jgi:hypothetical protein
LYKINQNSIKMATVKLTLNVEEGKVTELKEVLRNFGGAIIVRQPKFVVPKNGIRAKRTVAQHKTESVLKQVEAGLMDVKKIIDGKAPKKSLLELLNEEN